MGHTSSKSAGIGDDDGRKTTANSAVVSQTVTESGSITMKIASNAQTKGIGVGNSIKSDKFHGTDGYIAYYPDGERYECADWVSVFLYLDKPASPEDVVMADFQFSLLGVSGGGGEECDVTLGANVTRGGDSCHRRQDDVPPSDLHGDFGDLLKSGFGADVKFKVGGQLFAAHSSVLATRSPVFMAELFGTPEEGESKDVATTNCTIRIGDMDASVFWAMLHFIYTETLPCIEEGDRRHMLKCLCAAARRYDIKRLKLICKDMLHKGDI
uniref:BTB domain-containing protein n=1 Tax=Leersia perrieri TaxID=77586 RepID=A0A0D9XVB9_9ORYZ